MTNSPATRSVNLRASRQWASRPADQRYWGLADLGVALHEEMLQSAEGLVPTAEIDLVLSDEDRNIYLTYPGDEGQEKTALTNWSARQFSYFAGGTPLDFLAKLPDQTVQTVLNDYTLPALRQQESVNLLRSGGEIKAVSSETYARLFNYEAIQCLRALEQAGWRVPPARPSCYDPRTRPATEADCLKNWETFTLAVKPGDDIAPAGVYHSDRNTFVLMVDDSDPLDAGHSGLMRGMILENSDVGGGSASLTTFYLEGVCGNHILWGVSEETQFKKKHTKNNIANWDKLASYFLYGFTKYQSGGILDAITAAKAKEIAPDDKLVDTAFYLPVLRKKQTTKTVIEAAYKVAKEHEHELGAPPNTVWGLVHGLTRVSQSAENYDNRTAIDAAASALLQTVV